MVNEQTGISGEYRVAMYQAMHLSEITPSWRQFSDQHKLEMVRTLDPIKESTVSNVTCSGLFQWIADAMNASTGHPEPPSFIALGRSVGPVDTNDRRLDDPVAEVGLTEYDSGRNSVTFAAFVGEHEANVDVDAGETISEVGVGAETYDIFNHAILADEYEKDDQKTMTVEVTLTFRPESS